MRSKILKWGNSAAVRLPVAALEAARLSLDQPIEIVAEEKGLYIRAATQTPTLDDLLAGVTPENLNVDEEWQIDEPAGRELL